MIGLVIGASRESIYAIKLARARGYYVIALDGSPDAQGLQYADEAHVVDIRNTENIYKVLAGRRPDVILPAPTGRILAVSGAVNTHFGLKGVSLEAADICTDKLEFHNRLNAAGCRDCQCILLKKSSDIEVVQSYPVIVKPRYGSGSRGIYIAADRQELENIVNETAEELESEDYILETLVNGEEYGIDGMRFGGQTSVVLLRRKVVTPGHRQQCVGYISVQYEENRALYERAQKLMAKALSAVGAEDSVFHADLMVSGDSMFIIEMSARPSGHRLNDLFTPMATGISLVEQYLNYQDETTVIMHPESIRKLMIRYFDFEDELVIKMPDENRIREKYHVIEYQCNIREGQYMGKVTDGHSIMERGYFILEGSSDDELIRVGNEIMKEFVVRKGSHLLPVIGYHEPVIVSGRGSYVYDAQGRAYLDLNSGQFCTVLGHSDEGLAQCIADNARRLVHTNTGMLSDGIIEAADEINRISGSLDGYSIFLSTGAEAVEFCARYAKNLTGKDGLICFDKGYHGLTLGAQSITFGGIYTRPSVQDIYTVPVPDTWADEAGISRAAEAFEEIISKNHEKIAAAILEPIVSVGGMIFPAAGYFSRVRKMCDRYGVLLIFDECQTGFGRTGEWFAYQTLGVLPDMIACAKAIGLGYPVSMAMMSSAIIPDGGFAMTHYSSHQNDAFAAAVVKYGIECIEKEGLLKTNREKGQYFLQRLQELSDDDNIGLVRARGCGMMLGADLQVDKITDYRSYYAQLAQKAAANGIIIQGTAGGRVLRFLPDYRIEYKDIDKCITILARLLRRDN